MPSGYWRPLNIGTCQFRQIENDKPVTPVRCVFHASGVKITDHIHQVVTLNGKRWDLLVLYEVFNNQRYICLSSFLRIPWVDFLINFQSIFKTQLSVVCQFNCMEIFSCEFWESLPMFGIWAKVFEIYSFLKFIYYKKEHFIRSNRNSTILKSCTSKFKFSCCRAIWLHFNCNLLRTLLTTNQF